MKRLIIICEGETEKIFCLKILYPYLLLKNIILQASSIDKSGGGIVKWSSLKHQILIYLKNEKDVFVTTLIDFYGIEAKHLFPNWTNSLSILDKNHKMDFLEFEMEKDLEKNFRFIPYIQLHEFEGLLFNNIEVFRKIIPNEDLIGIEELNQIFNDYENPEMINNHKKSIPSERLKRIINGYNKIVYVDIIAEEIGLTRIRNKSPRFNQWLINLENIINI